MPRPSSTKSSMSGSRGSTLGPLNSSTFQAVRCRHTPRKGPSASRCGGPGRCPMPAAHRQPPCSSARRKTPGPAAAANARRSGAIAWAASRPGCAGFTRESKNESMVLCRLARPAVKQVTSRPSGYATSKLREGRTRSHALRGNARLDALRPGSGMLRCRRLGCPWTGRRASRPAFHAERGNEYECKKGNQTQSLQPNGEETTARRATDHQGDAPPGGIPAGPLGRAPGEPVGSVAGSPGGPQFRNVWYSTTSGSLAGL